MKLLKSLTLAAILSVGLFFTVRSVSAVPHHRMWVSSGDINNIAAIYTDKFSVSFEGHTFGSQKKSGFYIVDGRSSGPRIPWADETFVIEQSDGVEYGYSANRRLFTLKFKNHRVKYSHLLNTLNVDGTEFSTANKNVHVVVERNGQISQTK